MIIRHAGTVVVADDLDANLDLFVRLLTREGYTVHPARDGATALDLVQRFTPDLVLSDVVMPRMSGVELAAEARAIVPGMPFVFMSGYSSDHAAMFGPWAHKERLLAKPLQVTSLASALTQAIEEQAPR